MRRILLFAIFIIVLAFPACENGNSLPVDNPTKDDPPVVIPNLSGSLSITADGENVSFADIGTELTADYSGTEIVSLQWNRDGTDISGATGQKYTPNALGSYTVTASKEGCNSKTAAVTVRMGIEMVWVPGGSFELGRNLGTGGGGNVNPVSEVTLSGFHISKYPVTQAQYRELMGTNPSFFTVASGWPPDEGESAEDRPVEQVRWYDAIVFCNRLSMKEGLTPAYRIDGSTDPSDWGRVPSGETNARWDAVEIVGGSTGYRLPTEAQWEYAAKGGDPSAEGWVGYTYSGSDNPDDVAWYGANSGASGKRKTHQVGLKLPNGLRLYDMSGNVMEWVWDWQGSYAAGTDPSGPATGFIRVLRGGGYFWQVAATRCVYRFDYGPYYNYDYISFRLSRP